MLCEVISWIPDAVASALRDDRQAEPIIAWLTNIRGCIEEYDPLITVKSQSPDLEDSDSSSKTDDSAFDDILSQIGQEIYKLDEYQKSLDPNDKEISLSILNIFDECLEGMKKSSGIDKENKSDLEVISEIEVKPLENGVNGVDDSDCESTLSDVSFVTSTPAKMEKGNVEVDIAPTCDKSEGTPVPPRKARLKTPVSSIESLKDTKTEEDHSKHNGVTKRLSNSDSESTCWSYKECSDFEEPQTNAKSNYSAVWSHSSGFHNSDRILMSVLSQHHHHATVSRLSFETVSDYVPDADFAVYALDDCGVGGERRCDSAPVVVEMTPDKPTDDDGYEPVRDAITDENIYEEIEYGHSYTDEGCSCEGSVEVESCSISASSELDRESPLYVNLKDHDAYSLPQDVIFWKNLLLDPYYNDDEEDEWITPEECAVYSREQRPPLVIPRITQYRAPKRQTHVQHYVEEPPEPVIKPPIRSNYDWSPGSERARDHDRSYGKHNDSPPFNRINKRIGGSTENLLARRPNHLQLAASSSGDSLDIEIRDRKPGYARNSKSRSMVAPKQIARSPIPAPRLLVPHHNEMTVLMEGPVRRTKFSESGKKCRKNWVDCYMVLTPTDLIFYKKMPRPPGTPPSPGSVHPELVLPLKNAHVIPCIQNHTKRFTRSLVLTVGYDQWLLQDETEDGAKMWMKGIVSVSYKLGPPKVDDDVPQHHYYSSATDVDSLGKTPPVSRHTNRSNQKAGGSSNEDLSDSTEVSIPKVKRTLRSFFAKRPTMDSLVKKGIYQEEPVFGRKLEEVCPTTSPRVPEFVVACIKVIERSEENMSTDGLYRASGNLSQVQKIRLEVDQNNLSVLTNENTDIHVLTGSLKLFFRELKEPLIPCTMFDRVLAACSIKPRDAKIKEFRDIVNTLPQCNRETLKFLLEHLLRVTQYSERNRMHTANLAIVFGPTLLWAPAEQAHNIAIDCIQQNHVVEILLNEFKDIFIEIGKAKKKS